MLVIFLCGLVALILMRTLKNDCARYAEDDDLELVSTVIIDKLKGCGGEGG